MFRLNPFQLVRRMMAPVVEPPDEVSERVHLLEDLEEDPTSSGDTNPT